MEKNQWVLNPSLTQPVDSPGLREQRFFKFGGQNFSTSRNGRGENREQNGVTGSYIQGWQGWHAFLVYCHTFILCLFLFIYIYNTYVYVLWPAWASLFAIWPFVLEGGYVPRTICHLCRYSFIGWFWFLYQVVGSISLTKLVVYGCNNCHFWCQINYDT